MIRVLPLVCGVLKNGVLKNGVLKNNSGPSVVAV